MMVAGEDWHFLSHRMGLARAARAAGWRVVVVVPPGDGSVAIRREGFELETVRISRNISTPWVDVAAVAAIARLCRRHRVDLIHGFALKPALVSSFAALLAGLPAAVTVAGLGYAFISDTLQTRILRRIVATGFRTLVGRRDRAVIVQNCDDRAMMERLVGMERVHVVRGSGVDAARFHPLPEPENGVPVAVLPARMLWDKGVNELVEAARLLKRRGVPIRVVLAGGADPGNPKSIAEDQLRNWQAEGVVEWWGHQTDMVDVWRRAHIAVLPSYREGLPKALLEAGACGRPAITTDVPGCRELVSHEHNGLLVPAREVEPLADALERLARSPEDRARLGASGRARVETEFADQVVHREILAIYDCLVAKDAEASAPVRV